jgi:O-succinylbenzoic acid--CoA ligase
VTPPLLPVALRRHAAARPLAIAVRDAGGELTLAGLDRAVDAMAAGLQASGVEVGSRVAFLLSPSSESIALFLGIARAGGVAVPLGTRLVAREVRVAVAETEPLLLIAEAASRAQAAAAGVPWAAPADLVERARGEGPRGVEVDPAAPAVAILTSGTTGRPRAALLSHGALAASAAAWTAALPTATGWLLCLGLAHVAGLGVAWRALGAGVPLDVTGPFEAEAVLARLGGPSAVSHCSLVPVQLARLLDAAGDAPPPPAVRAVLLGGAPIPAALVQRATAAGWPVVPTYGLTEAGSGVTALPAAEAGDVPGSAGRPLPGVGLRIAEPGPDGVGEIEVLTPAAFSGYLGRRDDDAASFTHDGWLRTGDLGRLDATARLFVVDRRTDFVVSGGENVSPAEVEAVLAAHPAIADAGVAGRPDARWGSVPVAGVVLAADAPDPGDEELLAWCRARLAPYKVPAAICRLDTLPRTSGGKLRRRELRDRLTPFVVVLHATLSTGRQLAPLARELVAAELRVVAPDRRGSGARRLDPPRAVAVEEHLADLEALLDAEGVDGAVLLGHSFGGVVALEAAARLADRVVAVVAYEPPYGPVADVQTRRAFARVARETAAAAAAGGPPAAARAFMQGVAARGSWEALPGRTRAFLEDEGGGAVADAAMEGLQPDGLAGIACPVTVVTGGDSEPFYAPIADALAVRIPGARRVILAGLRHTAPITDPGPIASAARAAIAAGFEEIDRSAALHAPELAASAALQPEETPA